MLTASATAGRAPWTIMREWGRQNEGQAAATAAAEGALDPPPVLTTGALEDAEKTSDLMRTYSAMAEELRSRGDIQGA
eukprot:7831261-Pyramimonas_sp.AAC.1